MERVNIQFEENTLKKVRLVAALEKKSVAAVVREATNAYLTTKQDLKEQVNEVLHADDSSFEAALQESFQSMGPVYKKLAE